MGDVFAEMEQEIAVDIKKFSKVEEVSAENFIKTAPPADFTFCLMSLSAILPEYAQEKPFFHLNITGASGFSGAIRDTKLA